MNLHDITTHKRHVKGQDENGQKWLYLNDYDLGFIETEYRRGGGLTYRLIQSKSEPISAKYPLFDLLTLEQVEELISNNLP